MWSVCVVFFFAHCGTDDCALPVLACARSNPNVAYTPTHITSKYLYEKNHVDVDGQKLIITPQKHEYTSVKQRRIQAR